MTADRSPLSQVYRNEEEVGTGLKESGLARKDVWCVVFRLPAIVDTNEIADHQRNYQGHVEVVRSLAW